ncbi:MAG: putative transposase [Chitinophagales bacterium]|jgi:REP element-mobilizing transposase RayT
MSEFRKTTYDDLYFITLTIVDWINLFDKLEYKDIIVRNLAYCIKNEHLKIYAYVIMSNHLHMICSRGEKDLNELLGRFKSYTSKAFLKEINENPKESRRDWLLILFRRASRKNNQYSKHHLWQYTNHPVLLDSHFIIQQKVDYIHVNPVRAGIVSEAHCYKYSSACLDGPLKMMGM